jgi:hypothetical protein
MSNGFSLEIKHTNPRLCLQLILPPALFVAYYTRGIGHFGQLYLKNILLSIMTRMRHGWWLVGQRPWNLTQEPRLYMEVKDQLYVLSPSWIRTLCLPFFNIVTYVWTQVILYLNTAFKLMGNSYICIECSFNEIFPFSKKGYRIQIICRTAQT